MLLRLQEASGVDYGELKRMDVFEFMTIYNNRVQEARNRKKNG
jgi:hypothetical protein